MDTKDIRPESILMSSPIDFLETSFTPAVADKTSVHHNIDNIIMDSEIDSFYKNPKESSYGKPYTYKANLGDLPYTESTPLNMEHYADIIEKTNLSKSLSPVIEKYLPGHGESIEKDIVNKLRKGDAPGGLVAYYEPYRQAKDIGGHYTSSKNTTSPDTIRIFADAYKRGLSTDVRNLASFRFTPPLTGVHPKYGEWTIDTKASARYGTTLHEPIHGIKFPRKVAGMNQMWHTHKEEGFSQADFRNYVKEMAENFKSKYGGEILRRQLNRLLKGKPKHKESVMVQDVFNDLFPDEVIHEKLR
mgnify:CR=1 FL=1